MKREELIKEFGKFLPHHGECFHELNTKMPCDCKVAKIKRRIADFIIKREADKDATIARLTVFRDTYVSVLENYTNQLSDECEKNRVLTAELAEAREWIKKSHHHDGCTWADGDYQSKKQKCDCGKLEILKES